MARLGGRVRRNAGRNVLMFMVLVLVALVIGSCETEPPEEEAPALTNPFRGAVRMGEGLMYEIEGFTHGHHPQYASRFNLTFTNATQDTWRVNYCLLLLDTEGVVKTLLRGSPEVRPGGSQEEGVESTWALDLAPGPYGLAVVVPERSTQINTVWVGDEPPVSREPGHAPEDGLTAGPWPAVASCP